MKTTDPTPASPAQQDRDPSRYRPNVGLAVFHRTGLVFLGKRLGVTGPHIWQMPQGGVDRGEDPRDAAFRELEEEIGVPPRLAKIIDVTEDWLYYDLPGGYRRETGYLGQRQKWFAFRYLGRDADIRLDAHTPEFSDWRWGRLDEAAELVIPFKRAVYEEVARRFAGHARGPGG
jgi:putative (di)nucleoside polyphosphate hydrolase